MADLEPTFLAFLQFASKHEISQLIVELQNAAQYEDILEVLCEKFDSQK
ncbi:hypothetical protein [Paenibacillus taiwanensis]|nr:hypothetical protein [Paenibacillus taiwanensis]